MNTTSLLSIESLNAGYGFLQILWNVSLSVNQGEYIFLIGPNGAGKSTILKCIAGFLNPPKGHIAFKGQSIVGLPAEAVSRKGISYISEEMNLFWDMSVEENLSLGAYQLKDKSQIRENFEFVFELFPILNSRRKQLAGTMSGGERKMLAIARGLMSSPSLLLVDEPSLGLAPQLSSAVFQALDILNRQGLTILLVEQNVSRTLQVTERGYVLEKGIIVIEGGSRELAQTDHIRKAYLGL